MPKRIVLQDGAQRYVVLPYTHFGQLGFATEPEKPQVAVPLYDGVAECLAEPSRLAADYEADLRRQGLAGITAVLRDAQKQSQAGSSGGPAVPPSERALIYEDKMRFPFVMFRGESREEHGLLPSLFRHLGAGDAKAQDGEVDRRRHREARLARRIGWAMRLSRATRLSSFQARAAARHYGAASPILDFSFDPRVSAYFSHPAMKPGERAGLAQGQTPIGILYCLSYQRLQEIFPVQGWGNGENGEVVITFILAGGELRVPYLSWNAGTGGIERSKLAIAIPPHLTNATIQLRCVAVPGIARIHAQQGLFFEIDSPAFTDWRMACCFWYLIDFICQKWCFVRGREAFQLPANGISTRSLLPADAWPIRLAVGGRRMRRHHRSAL